MEHSIVFRMKFSNLKVNHHTNVAFKFVCIFSNVLINIKYGSDCMNMSIIKKFEYHLYFVDQYNQVKKKSCYI